MKSILIISLLLACALATKVHLTSHAADDWKKLDVNNLNDDQQDVDEFIRDAIDKLDGDLVGAATFDNFYRYVYKTSDTENWDVQVRRNDDENEILVATRTESYPDGDDPNLTVNKKTSIIKKSLADIVAKEI